MEREWKLKEQGDPEVVTSLAESLSVEPALANLLIQRGVNSYEEAKFFFRPELSSLHDPFLMRDMDAAIERIYLAINRGERILVYGDYDVDGTTAVALVYTFLKKRYDKLGFYVPDRYSEGYGISIKGIDFAAENAYSLIIALDCGIKAVQKVLYAKEKGIDFIICDHHRPGDELPAAVAVLDAKRNDCTYPFDELSGCGVGYKLIQAFSMRYSPDEDLSEYLDLVVVSIAADIVPITGENRILAYYGLQRINSHPRPGFEAILHFSNIKRNKPGTTHTSVFGRNLSISDLVFMVGPRINAAGRIENAGNSVELLISSALKPAMEIGEQINDFNTERRRLDEETTRQAIELIRSDEACLNAKATVIFREGWHKGVIGIVASRLTELFYKPTIVLTRAEELITGSARSVKDFDIYDAIDSCSDLLEHFGGHKYAAGLSMKAEIFPTFKKRFEEYVSNSITDQMLIPEIEVDAELSFCEITPKFYRILKQFAPFGPGNMAPVFRTNNVIDSGYARIVGKKQNDHREIDDSRKHLKLTLAEANRRSAPFSAIAFQQGQHLQNIVDGLPFDITYHIEENDWNGHNSLQLNIKDIKMTVG
jgi:single-stranded-DNA-specific exonuclease